MIFLDPHEMISLLSIILHVDYSIVNFGFVGGEGSMLMGGPGLVILLIITIAICGRLPQCHCRRAKCFRRCFSRSNLMINCSVICRPGYRHI
jgi:hypothetical protein